MPGPCPVRGGGGVMLKFHVDRRITDLGEKSRVPQIGKSSAQLAGIPATRVLVLRVFKTITKFLYFVKFIYQGATDTYRSSLSSAPSSKDCIGNFKHTQIVLHACHHKYNLNLANFLGPSALSCEMHLVQIMVKNCFNKFLTTSRECLRRA